MKNQMLIGGTILMLAASSVLGEEGQSDTYRAHELSLDVFGTGTIGQQTIDNLTGTRIRHDIRLGAGAGLNYFLTRNIGFGVEAYSENPGHSFVDSVSANLLLRLPLGQSGFAPYALAGAGRQFDPTERWLVQLGAGLEFRFSPKMGIFTDARYVMTDGGRNYGMGRAGLRFSF